MILITTAGKVGSEAARLLAQPGEPVRVLVRDPEKATALAQAGVDVVDGDLEVPGDHRRGDARRLARGARQPGGPGPGAERDRQRRPRRGRARREDHQQSLGGLADRPAPQPDRDRERADRLRARLHAAAQQRLHAELPDDGAWDRRDEQLQHRNRRRSHRPRRRARRRRRCRRDRRVTRRARRKDLLAHRARVALRPRTWRRCSRRCSAGRSPSIRSPSKSRSRR